jgi:hypothetical protein
MFFLGVLTFAPLFLPLVTVKKNGQFSNMPHRVDVIPSTPRRVLGLGGN